ncbi:hypothetical protein Tco_0809571 [Tanacetum coccineum]
MKLSKIIKTETDKKLRCTVKKKVQKESLYLLALFMAKGDTTFKLNTDINDTDYFERLLEHDPTYQIHAGPQVSSLDLAAPINDNHNDPPACTHPNAYNLHLITPYTLNDQHQQCTTIRDVTGLVVRNSEESHACVPNLQWWLKGKASKARALGPQFFKAPDFLRLSVYI